MAFAGRMLSLSLLTLIVAASVASNVVADPPQKPDSVSQRKTVNKQASPENSDSVKREASKSGSRRNNKTESADNSRKSKGDQTVSSTAAISKSREKAAIEFARKHHPELARLLEGLRKNDPRNFQAGLRDLTREVERLAKLAERDDERYQASLELWKAGSRLRLEVARLSMSPGEDFEPRLRPLIKKQYAARIRLLSIERRKMLERLARYDEQLKTLTADPEKLVASEIARFQKVVAGRARAKGARPQTSTDVSNSTTAQNKIRQPKPKSKTSSTRKSPTTSAD